MSSDSINLFELDQHYILNMNTFKLIFFYFGLDSRLKNKNEHNL